MPPLTAAKEQSLIYRLPAGLRIEAMNRISANANAPGGCKRQIGRAQKAATKRLAGTMGIYAIEATRTGALAYSVGGASPVTITIQSGTPASTVIATEELDPVTWAAPGSYNLLAQSGTDLLGNAKLGVS